MKKCFKISFSQIPEDNSREGILLQGFLCREGCPYERSVSPEKQQELFREVYRRKEHSYEYTREKGI